MRCAPAMESSLDDAMRRAFARAARGSIASSSRASTRARVDVPVASWTTRVASIRAPWARAWNQRDDGPRISRRARASTSTPDDPYVLLGVSPSCTADELKRAYRREALKWHPDRHPDGAEKTAAEARFKKISAAYQELSAPGGRQRASSASSRASTGGAARGGYGYGGGGGAAEDFARRAGGAYRYEYRKDFTREDAERVFREMFGNDSSSFIRDIERALREQAMRGGRPGAGGFPGGGFGGGFPGGPGFGGFAYGRGMSAYDLNDLFKTLFDAQATMRSDGGGANEVRETSYVNARGETVIRRVVRTRAPNGMVSESVTERVVGRGGTGTGDPWRHRSTSSSSTSTGARGSPPPPHGAVVGVNPLVELAVGAARVARIAFVRFVAAFGARLLQQIARAVIRFIFRGGRF